MIRRHSIVRHILISLVCICISAAGFFLFYRDINAAFTKANEAPIATIEMKKNIAQRHFEGRLVWDQLKDGSPLYNGDTIRTASLSGAVVVFPDNTRIDLYDNTLVKVVQGDDGATLDVATGSLLVDVAEGAAPLAVTAGGKTVQVEQGKPMAAAVSDKGMEVEDAKEKPPAVTVADTKEAPPPADAPPPEPIPVIVEEPPLAPPANLSPRFDAYYGNAALLRSRRVNFAWDAVAEAAGYFLTVWRQDVSSAGGGVANVPLIETMCQSPSYTIPDITKYGNGTYTWQVSAFTRGENNAITKVSEAAQSRFTVDARPPQKTEVLP